ERMGRTASALRGAPPAALRSRPALCVFRSARTRSVQRIRRENARSVSTPNDLVLHARSDAGAPTERPVSRDRGPVPRRRWARWLSLRPGAARRTPGESAFVAPGAALVGSGCARALWLREGHVGRRRSRCCLLARTG